MELAACQKAVAALQRQTAALQLLQDVAVAANQAKTAVPVFQFALEQICAYTGWLVGHAYLVEQDQTLCLCGSWYATDAGALALPPHDTGDFLLPPWGSLLSRVLAEGQPVWVTESDIEAFSLPDEVTLKQGVQRGLVWPVQLKDEVVAILEFLYSDALEPDESLLEAVNQAASQLARVVERERAEKTLKMEREKYRRLFDEAQRTREFTQRLIEGSVDGILAFDRECRYVLWNPAMERITGFSQSQVIGRVAFEIFPFLVESHEDELYHRTLTGETTVVRNKMYKIPETERQGFYDAHRSPIFDESGSIIGGLSIIREVTERKLAEDALHESRQLLQSSLDALSTYVVVLDEEGTIITVNAAWRHFAEIEAAPWSVQGRVGSDYLSICKRAQQAGIDEAAALSKGIGAVMTNEQVAFYMEYACESLHEENWFVVRVTRFGGDVGPVRLVVAHDNVTPLREAEAARRKSEQQFRAIYEGAGLGIMVMDLEGQILQSNPALQAKLRYSEPALRQLRFRDLLHPDHLEEHEQHYQRLLSGEVERYKTEYRCHRADGTVIWVHITMSLLRDERGEAYHALGMVQDISAQKQIASELAEVQHRLSGSRERERLRIAQELHDGPVQDLIGADLQLKLLHGRLENEDNQAKIKVVRDVVQQVNRKLRELCGELRPPTLAPFGLEVAIRSHLEQFQEHHPQLKVQYSLVRDGKLLPEPMRLALFRIYQEMINNVVKHAQARHILVRFNLDVEQIVLEVQDDGIGFQVPQRWIQLARQGHLGLVGISERAEEINGRLIILSAPGRGTIVRVIVPSPLSPAYGTGDEKLTDNN